MECWEQLHAAELIAPTDTRTGNGEPRQMSHLKVKRFPDYFWYHYRKHKPISQRDIYYILAGAIIECAANGITRDSRGTDHATLATFTRDVTQIYVYPNVFITSKSRGRYNFFLKISKLSCIVGVVDPTPTVPVPAYGS